MKSREYTIHELRELVQNASRYNPHLTSRLEKAAFLVLLRPIVSVGDGHCECSDYLRHGAGHPCKHRLALVLDRKLGFSDGLLCPPSTVSR